MSPLVGYIIDKTDHKRAIIAIASLTLAILIVCIPTAASWMLALMFMIGISQAFIPPPIFALSAEVTEPEKLGLGFGIISTCLNLGILIGPAITGLIRDAMDSYQGSYALMSVFTLMIFIVMIIFRRMQKHMRSIRTNI